MANYDDELLAAAQRLVARPKGKRGPLPSARIRRSISTSYYALFHFLLDEAGNRLVGTRNDLRRRRRIIARSFTHAGVKAALSRVQSATVERTIVDFLCLPNLTSATTPFFAQNLAITFLDALAKRHDADYDLNKLLSESDAKYLRRRVQRAIAGWRSATGSADRDFKHALCLLMLLKGTLRREN